MEWGKRKPGSSSKRRSGAFWPEAESLEGRQLLTTFDLSTTQTAPLGVQFVGKASNNTSGYTVTDVGNVTGSGYDSFVVSAPGLPNTGIGGTPSFGAAGESAAYLVFGSKQVNVNNAADFLKLANGTTNGTTTTLTGGNRAGDLGELGTLGVASQSGTTNPTAQTNPTVAQPQPPQDSTHVYGFNFDGLTFVTGLDTATGLGRNSALGFSVTPLGDINSDGYDDFAISAPNDAGGGRVFVIYGGTALATQSTTTKTIDLEPTAGTNNLSTPTKVVSFSLGGATTGTDVGYSVAGLGNYFNTSNGRDIAIGVPGQTVSGLANAGAVYAISGNFVNAVATGTNVDLTTVGNGSNTTAGIVYTGTAAGALTGTSVASAGNTDGQTGSGKPLDNLLIGAPGAFLGGGAYLVYASQSYVPNSTLGTTQSLASLGQTPTTNPVTNPLQGAVFGDQNSGDRLGFAVASAGDFNSDGLDDILLGAPGYNLSTGFAYVVYGVAGTTSATSTRLNGVFVVNPLAATTGLTSTSFIGQATGDFTGYSLAPTAHIVIGSSTAAAPNSDILIGAPGAVGGGEAYLVPGTASGVATLTVPQNLSTINSTLGGSLFQVSGTSDPAIITSGFGTSVSARNPIFDANTLNTTVDNDNVPDLFIGAPFSSLVDPVSGLTVTRSLAGVTYVVEGGFIGGTSSGGGGGGGGTTTGLTSLTAFPNAFGLLNPVQFLGDNYGLPFPQVSKLEQLSSYAPLPVQIAYQQYRPAAGNLARQNAALHPKQKGNYHQAPAGTIENVAAITHSENKYSKVNTLAPHVFHRGKTKVGKPLTFTHKVKVIPRSQQTEHYPG
jgi:hypothetical protein